MKRRNGSADPSSSVWRLTSRTPVAETVDESLLGTVDVNLDDDLAALTDGQRCGLGDLAGQRQGTLEGTALRIPPCHPAMWVTAIRTIH